MVFSWRSKHVKSMYLGLSCANGKRGLFGTRELKVHNLRPGDLGCGTQKLEVI